MPGDGQELWLVMSSCSPQAHLAPRWCKAAGSWPTATHGLRGPAPRPLALFDRGSGLQKKEAQVQSQDGCALWCVVGCGMYVQNTLGKRLSG